MKSKQKKKLPSEHWPKESETVEVDAENVPGGH